MSQLVTITGATLTLDPVQQRTRIDLVYNQTVPATSGVTNDLPCKLQVSYTGTVGTFKDVVGGDGSINAVNGTGSKSTSYGVFRAGQPVFLQLVSSEPSVAQTATTGNTGNVISNVFNAGTAPSA